ncbi:MAG: hypothetical protein GWP39_05655 [Planctomycetia bacterium]|nr:hypothetical protein [Planctomycetia bacterium]
MQRSRIIVLVVIFLLVSIVIGMRLYKLQIVEWREHAQRAANTHRSIMYSPGPRGKILDRNGTVLAQSVPIIRATFLLSELEQCRWVARRLRSLLGKDSEMYPWDENVLWLSLETIRETFRRQLKSGDVPASIVWLKNIDPITSSRIAKALRSRPENFPGVDLRINDEGVGVLSLDPSLLFAGEVGVRRLSKWHPEYTPDQLWEKVQIQYDKVRDDSDEGITDKGDLAKARQIRNRIFRVKRHVLISNLNPDLVIEICMNPDRWPGIHLEEVDMREYPRNPMWGQLLGRTTLSNRKNQLDFKKNEEILIDQISLKDIRTVSAIQNDARHSADQVGQEGLESYLEDQLRGRPGAKIRIVDYRRKQVGLAGTMLEAIPGKDVSLTVDVEFSEYCVDLLRDEFQYNPPLDDGPASGAMVFLDVQSGEVLGLSPIPLQGVEVFKDSSLYEERKGEPSAGWFLDRCLGWPIDPGSTFKPIVALIALSEGVLSPGETIDCQGYFDPQDRRANRCENHSRGPIGLEEALAKSCNVFFYKLGQRLGLEKLIAGAEDFGFWQATIESDWRNADGDKFDKIPSENYGRKPITNPVGAAIGRGFVVTPIQMAKAAMLLARRGDASPVKMFQVSDSATRITKDRGRPVLDHLEPDHFESVIQGMQEAIEYGSAKNSRLKDFNAAVKTGTVRVMKKNDQGVIVSSDYKHAWMIGFAPVDHPKVAFAIVLQNQEKSGGKVAPLLEDALDWLQDNRGMKFR